MGPVLVVEVFEVPEGVQEVALVPDESCGARLLDLARLVGSSGLR